MRVANFFDKELLLKFIIVPAIAGITTAIFGALNFILAIYNFNIHGISSAVFIEIAYVVTWVAVLVIISLINTGRFLGLRFQFRSGWWREVLVFLAGWGVVIGISILSILFSERYFDNVMIQEEFRYNIRKIMISYLIFGSFLSIAWRIYPNQVGGGSNSEDSVQIK